MKEQELKGLKETVEGIIAKLDSLGLTDIEKTLMLEALKDKLFDLDIKYQRDENNKNLVFFEDEKKSLR